MKRNVCSTIASFKTEGIVVSEEALKYSELREAGKVSCEEEVIRLKRKYKKLAEER